jgi:NAD(P)-dependent dehydrogenase (short-subunit alcohol dehydrogenase family)
MLLIQNKVNSLFNFYIFIQGVMMCPYWLTKDGFEMQFGVNHLGHFLLTNLLLDLLKSTENSRIINVSSRAHSGILFDYGMNWQDLNWTKNYDPMKAYSQSKLANILFTKELAKRLKNDRILVFSLHPGAVRTELVRYCGDGLFAFFPFLFKLISPIWWYFTKSPLQGAQTTIHCATADNLNKFNGYYFR